MAAIRPTMTLGTTGLKESAGIIDEEFLLRLRGNLAGFPGSAKDHEEGIAGGAGGGVEGIAPDLDGGRAAVPRLREYNPGGE